MIEPKELISENILFSISWKHESRKYYVYLTKSKFYKYDYDECSQSYIYEVCPVKDFGGIHCQAYSHVPPGHLDCACHCLVFIGSRYRNGQSLVSFDFPTTQEGANAAEKLYVALSKVME